jgi:putative ABC transport system permease protein
MVDRQVLMPLDRMQWLTDIPDGATEVLVFGSVHEEVPAIASQLRGVPGLAGLTVQAWNEREPLGSMTQMVATTRFIIAFIVGLLAALGIWNTMTTSVLERTREIGVLRAMGLTRVGAVALFVFEALTIAVVGGVAGLALGAGPSWLLEKYGIRIGEQTAAQMSMPIAETLYGQLTLSVVMTAFLLGLATAAVGSLLPALRAASIQPVSAMRTGS